MQNKQNPTRIFQIVQTKARKHTPAIDTHFTVELERNKQISIYKNGKLVNDFVLGDEAEYDSYNLIYTGKISKITDKIVQIISYPGTSNERKHNLSLYEFCWRNWNFDAAETHQHNQNEMYFI